MTDDNDAIVEFPLAAPSPVIAVGGDLKRSICVIEGSKATMTRPTGSLIDAENYRRFIGELREVVERLANRVQPCGASPLVLAHDLHPTYLSTVAARKLGSNAEAVVCEGIQHHHAHVAACLAEHGLMQPAIGVACDGAGYGTDGAVWGCEVLYATPADFQRCAHLQYFPLPGGDAAAKQTWRPALSLVHQAYAGGLPSHVRGLFDRIAAAELDTIRAMLSSGLNCPQTSSLGRLFDAVAFLTGVCDFNDTEGRAAIQLQEAAEGGPDNPYSVRIIDSDGGDRRIVVSDMIVEICGDRRDDVSPGVIASRFHSTVAKMLSEAALAAARAHHVETVALTGGCFLNRILVERTERLLLQGGVKQVLKHERLSPGDDSLSLGQAVVAAARLAGE